MNQIMERFIYETNIQMLKVLKINLICIEKLLGILIFFLNQSTQ